MSVWVVPSGCFDWTGTGGQRWERMRDGPVGQVAEELVAVEREGGDVDERLDVGVAAGGLRDHSAAVGVTDEDLRPLDAVEETADGRGVGLQIEQRVRCGADGVAVAAQPVDDPGEPGRVGECAVHEHDRRLGVRRAGVGGHREGERGEGDGGERDGGERASQMAKGVTGQVPVLPWS
jgi:hypothetical protein